MIGKKVFSCTSSEGDTELFGSLLNERARKWGSSDARDDLEEGVIAAKVANFVAGAKELNLKF